MPQKWYGWIPILSGNTYSTDALTILTRRQIESNQIRPWNTKDRHLILSAKKFLPNFLKKHKLGKNWTFYGTHIFSDICKEKLLVIISFEEKTYPSSSILISILKYSSGKFTKKIHTSCKIEQTGLIVIDGLRRELAIIVYKIIRDIFHLHTHHKEGDLLLPPVEKENKTDAIKSILEQYQNKIYDYHHFLKQYLVRKLKGFGSYHKVAEETIAQAKGEMLYAMSFLHLFQADIENRGFYENIFSNGYKSFEVIEQHLNISYLSLSNRKLVFLTWIISILTFVLVAFAFIQTSILFRSIIPK